MISSVEDEEDGGGAWEIEGVGGWEMDGAGGCDVGAVVCGDSLHVWEHIAGDQGHHGLQPEAAGSGGCG